MIDKIQIKFIQESFTQNIRKVRKRLGLSQEEVANKCGISTTYYRAIERGVKNPPLETIIKISIGLEIPTANLFQLNMVEDFNLPGEYSADIREFLTDRALLHLNHTSIDRLEKVVNILKLVSEL